jgi:DNA-binding transcriptional MocR family regulator
MPGHGGRRYLYQPVAADIRNKIASGELGPGAALRSQKQMAHDYEVSVDTVRRALADLRAEGLIETSRGETTRVCVPRVREPVWLRPGETIRIRMPISRERDKLQIGDGVPVFVVNDVAFPGDRFEFFAR